jgi:putative CocE/NonD family hydrolase
VLESGQSHPARAVREFEHVEIPMPDGVRLSARLWLPDGAEAAPVPAILEYIPYRKRDMVRERDERNHPVFAEHGYACLRVDMRGSGDSEGLMSDMYTDEEMADARHVIDWIATRDWCDGGVGMFGTSWGGTASLQAAVRAHPALKAVIAVCATHDRYHDDIHRIGGLVLTDTFEWGATMPAILALPPADDLVDETGSPHWREVWRNRLYDLAFPVTHWVGEDVRGDYWKRGSVIDEADAISCPILAVGGWSDSYSNSIIALMERAPDKVWGIVGPWGHHFPDAAHPGPGIGFQREALDWWDHWLGKDAGTTAAPWPRLRAWRREWDAPADVIDERNGAWIAMDAQPSAWTQPRRLHLTKDGLRSEPTRNTEWASVPDDLLVGQSAGDTGFFGRFGGQPLDQAEDDRRSLTFDAPILEEALDIVGAPGVDLTVAGDRPEGQVVLRLCDVAPDGTVARITHGVRDLAMSDDFATSTPLVPGKARRVRIALNTCAYRVAPGHRLRLSISSSYWPLVWPSAAPARLKIADGTLSIPVPVEPSHAPAEPLPPVERFDRHVRHDAVSCSTLERFRREGPDGVIESGWHQPYSSKRSHSTGIVFGYETEMTFRLDPSDSLSASVAVRHRLVCERPDGTAEVESTLLVRADAEAFHLDGALQATWDGETVHQVAWSPVVPRRSGAR